MDRGAGADGNVPASRAYRKVDTVKSNRVRFLLAVAATAAALTACTPTGTAAVVGGERISSAELNENIAAVKREAAAINADIDAPEALPAALPQVVLNHLVLIRQSEQLARRDGITVTESEIDQQIKRYEDAYQMPFDQLAPRVGIPRARIREWMRAQVVQNKVAPRLGINEQTTENEAMQKLDEALNAAAPVTWNPRYGKRVGLEGRFEMPERFGAADTGGDEE
jgi:peptidyl-prolyl cis-trans isomerase SurA